MNKNDIATYFICSSTLSVSTALCINTGTNPNNLANDYRAEWSSNIYTGSDMVIMDLPAIRLAVTCFTISFNTPFCNFSYYSLINVYSSEDVNFQEVPKLRKLLRALRLYPDEM
jgi:hypothetical protein